MWSSMLDTDAPWAVHCYREVIEDPKAEQSEVRLETDGFPQDADNLAWRAAEAFFDPHRQADQRP